MKAMTMAAALFLATTMMQVNSICFLEPHAALATCNLEGVVAVWWMGPAVPDPGKDDNVEESNRDEEGVDASLCI